MCEWRRKLASGKMPECKIYVTEKHMIEDNSVDPLCVMLQLELGRNNGRTSARKKNNMCVPALNSIHWCYRVHTPIPPLP